VDIVLLRYDGRMASEEVLARLDKDGYRPAELPEFLAFGATYPEVQRQFSVVGLVPRGRIAKATETYPACMRRLRRATSTCTGGTTDGIRTAALPQSASECHL